MRVAGLETALIFFSRQVPDSSLTSQPAEKAQPRTTAANTTNSTSITMTSSTSAMGGTAVMTESSNSHNPPSTAPVRSTTILGSLLRASRPRVAAAGPAGPDNTSSTSPSISSPPPVLSSPPSPVPPPTHRRRSFAPQALVIPPSNPLTTTSGLGISHILRRRRSIGSGTNALSPIPVSPSSDIPPTTAPPATTTTTSTTTTDAMPQVHRGLSTPSSTNPFPTYRIRLVPHLDSRRTLRFEPITRDLKDEDPPLRIGRFTDRAGLSLAAQNALNSSKLAFKSKVVSRAHAEIWLENGKFFIRDTKSSSGTFLNHLRLSAAGHESRPFLLRDGDILQLGVDYQGGSEDIYKSVKIRVEVGREWQAAANAFNMNAITQLKELGVGTEPLKPGESKGKKHPSKPNIPDCCICLFAVTIRQALFIAPCSHAFHYKCIRPLLEKHTTAFSCPLCRSFADLEEDVEVEPEAEPEAEADETDEEEDEEDSEARTPSVNRQRDIPGGVANTEGDALHGPVSAPTEGSRNTHTHARDRDHRENTHLTAPPHSQRCDGAETEDISCLLHLSLVLLSVPATPSLGVAPTLPHDTDEEMIDGALAADLYANGPGPDSHPDAWIRHARPGEREDGSEGEDAGEGEGSRSGSLGGWDERWHGEETVTYASQEATRMDTFTPPALHHCSTFHDDPSSTLTLSIGMNTLTLILSFSLGPPLYPFDIPRPRSGRRVRTFHPSIR
ncbi:hypothetical protein EDC04DRAFT_3012321 [Pisolithus marmoratus]|nr:hypothetical protein EDC04DRAFT_3012321 [Pisolithus marmoratus]